MIPAGKIFCPVCGSVFTELFYKNGTKSTGALLMRHPFTNLLDVKPYDPSSSTTPSEEITLITPKHLDGNEFPEHIKVQFKGDTEPLTMLRCCPKCTKQTTALYPEYGKYPLFVVMAMGDVGAGKTAWLGATGYISNLAAVNQANYPYALDSVTLSTSTQQSEATILDSRGNTKLLRIKSRNDKRVVADVLLLDSAGELFKNICPENTKLWDFLAKNPDFPGADAFVFLQPADAHSTAGEKMFNGCYSKGVFTNKPVAVVVNRLDKILESNQVPAVQDISKTKMVPWFSADTFDSPTSYLPEKMCFRMTLEHAVATQLLSYALQSEFVNSQGFLVQSCVDKKVTKKDDAGRDIPFLERNYDHSINVMDPLLWVLNQLHIFPVE
jgi:hypothetical protein